MNTISTIDINNAETFPSYALAAAAAARFYGDNFGLEYASQVKEDARQDIDQNTYAVQFYSGYDSAMDDVFVAKIVRHDYKEQR